MDEITTEKLILSGLCLDETYTRQVASYIKEEYFHDEIELSVYKLITDYFTKYNALPNKTVLLHESSLTDNEKFAGSCKSLIQNIFGLERPSDRSWLVEKTETFCRDKAIYNATLTAISIFDRSDNSLTANGAVDLLKAAIAITFDTKIGLDLIEDASELYDLYINKEDKIPFGLNILNQITNNGVGRQTLNIIAAMFGGGKTLMMCHLAADYIRQGYNVIYFSLEMSESEITKRIHSNILGISLNDYEIVGKEKFTNRIDRIKTKNYGTFKVKSFPTGVGNINHFRHTLDELKTKKNFTPDIIIADYLGIMSSINIKSGAANSNTYQKAISEELRALAYEQNAALFSCAQLNRGGISDTDVGLESLADCISLSGTADSMFAIIRTDELTAVGQLMIKQLKNRYSNKSENLRFILGVDLYTQTLYDVNESEQDDIINEKDLFKVSTNNTKNKFSKLDEN